MLMLKATNTAICFISEIRFIVSGGGTSSGFYNRLEVYYEPHISDFLNLRVGATAHFHGKFSGWQQQFSLVFNLQELLGRKNK